MNLRYYSNTHTFLVVQVGGLCVYESYPGYNQGSVLKLVSYLIQSTAIERQMLIEHNWTLFFRTAVQQYLILFGGNGHVPVIIKARHVLRYVLINNTYKWQII